MVRSIVWGVLSALGLGLAVVGCGDESDSVFTQGSTLRDGPFPGSSIATFNLADDGGALSPNQQAVQDLRVFWVGDCADSDGTFAGPTLSEAMLLFTTQQGSTFAVYACHFLNGQLTPPVRLEGEDQDTRVETDLDAAVAVCLTTRDYADADVRANAGHWVLLLPGRTAFEDPLLRQREDVSGPRVGPHDTLWSHVWLRDLRGTPAAQDDRVGSTARAFAYGFQSLGQEVPAVRGGGYTGPSLAPTPAPACDVTSFGVVSDALCGQADFGGSALPFSTSTSSTVHDLGATAYATAHPNTSLASYQPSRYRQGEAMTCLGLFYTQVVNSFSGGGSVSSADNSFSGGAGLQAFFASFDLTTLQFDTPARLDPPAARNASGSATSAGTAPYPSFHVYNTALFYTYADASLNAASSTAGLFDQNPLDMTRAPGDLFSYPQTGGYRGGLLHTTAFHEDVNAFLTVVDQGDGTCALDAHRDLALHTQSPGVHDTTNPTSDRPDGRINLAPNREIQSYNRSIAGTFGGAFLFGPDQGLQDLAAFYVSADNVRDVAGEDPDDNVDRALCAASITPAGDFVAAGAGANPSYVSRHQPDADGNLQAGPGVDVLQDPLVPSGAANGLGGESETVTNASLSLTGSAVWFDATLNRTGDSILLAYLQDLGTSDAFSQSLHVVAYQPPRDPSAIPTHDLRFSTPTRIDTDLAVTTPSSGTPESLDVWTSLPVNAFRFQDALGYRRGFQGDPHILNLLFEQSDATEDRLWVRQLTVQPTSSGTPTLTSTTAAEIHATPEVDGHSNTPGGRATFRFLDGDVRLGSRVRAVDAGLDASGDPGGVLVVYRAIVDHTSSDGDDADAEVRAVRVDGASVSDPVLVSRAVHENQLLAAPNPSGPFSSANASASAVPFLAGAILRLTPLPNNTNLQTNPGHSGARVDVHLTDATSDNGTGLRGLFAQRFLQNTTSSSEPFADRFLTTPVRLDGQRATVFDLQITQSGNTTLLFFQQAAHVWFQTTSNGSQFLNDNGAPRPTLVDNDSANFLGDYDLTTNPGSTGDAVDGLLTLIKADESGDDRAKARALVLASAGDLLN